MVSCECATQAGAAVGVMLSQVGVFLPVSGVGNYSTAVRF